MNSTEIRSILRSPYNRENWKNLYRNIFQNKVTFHEEPYPYNVNEDIVESLFQIGYATLDDEYIVALFEVNIKSDVNLLSKKIGLRKIISKYISDDKFNGVLTIFENGSPDYRFTFASKTTKITEEGIEVFETESKRFTYILGGNEACLTPSQRFEGLLKKNGSINLNDIKEAFSVDKLNKEFFNGYKENYEVLCNYFYLSHYKSSIFNDDDKLIRDFVKKFMGRIVFLYFVQKKGWLGVKNEQNWGTGDHQFLSNLFINFEEKEKFYSKILSKLFFEFLSVERSNDIVQLYYGFKIRIPYLNGGLFEKEAIDDNEINFEVSNLNSLFSFFDRFNFTIYEDDPNEHTVAVDPEMLGHIFENLLEDNKDKGAFYTPKEVVHYMCQESIIYYLTNWFKNKGYKIISSESFRINDQITLFTNNESRSGQLFISSESVYKNQIDRNIIEKLLTNQLDEHDKENLLLHRDELNLALDSLKICDPAIGSGAFPMGLLTEIFNAKQLLYYFEYNSLEDFPSTDIKLNIIQNSIYGVDIEKGAVDVARLRFWLSLIIEQEIPHPLPNLDFKIIVGNSLVSSFESQVIEIDWNLKFKNVDSVKSIILDQQNKLYLLEHNQHLYFKSYTKKEKLRTEIKRLKIEILQNQFLLNKIYYIEKNPILGGFFPTDKESSKNIQNNEYIENINKLTNKLDELKSDTSKTLDYFDWKLNFPEVLNEKINSTPGFDIIIGNPPYIGQKGNNHLFTPIKNSSLGKFHQRRMDYFYFFFHNSLNLAKESSIISFITTNYYLTATYADVLRKDIKDRSSILQLVNFNEYKIFDSAKGQHNVITFLQKNPFQNNNTFVINTKNKSSYTPLTLMNILRKNDIQTDYFTINTEKIFDGPENYIRLVYNDNVNNSLNEILNKISNNSCTLSNYCEISQGIITGCDKLSPKLIEKYKISANNGDGIFTLSESELSNLNLNKNELKFIKPWFKNSDIKRWFTNVNSNESLIYYTNKDNDNLGKNLEKHFRKYKKILINRNTRSGTDILTEIDYDNFVKNNKNISYVMIASSMKQGKYYCISYARDKNVFESPKIVVPQRSMKNTFAYNEVSWYASADVYFIISKSAHFPLKYILGLLNSKLIYFWLYHKGKRKGESLELYLTPLSEIPVKQVSNEYQNIIINLVNQIIDNPSDSLSIESKIDLILFKIYNFSYDEVMIIDSKFHLTRIEYEDFESK